MILLGHGADVVPQQSDSLELAQVFAAVHPELPGDVDFLRQHWQQSWILGREETRQNCQRTALLRGHELRNHAGAAQVGAGAGQYIRQVQQLRAECQIVDITDELMLAQICRAADGRVLVEVILGRVQLQTIVAEFAADVRAVFRAFQGDDNICLALGQADEVRQRQDIN